MGMLSCLFGIRKEKPPPPPPPPPREKLIHYSTIRRAVRIVRWVAVGALVLDIASLHGNANLQSLPPIIAMVFTACALTNCAPVFYGMAEDVMDQTPAIGRTPGHKVHTPLLNCGGASADWIAAGLTALATFFHGQCHDALARSDSTAMHALAAMFTTAALLVKAAVVAMYGMLSCIKSTADRSDLPVTRDGVAHTSGLVLF